MKTYTYRGETKTFREWAASSGIDIKTLRKRADRGYEDFLGPLQIKGAVIAVVYGEKMTQWDIVETFKIPYQTVSDWKSKNLNIEEQIELRKERNAEKLEAEEFP